MDERLVNSKLSGDSRSGRHLFSGLKEAGMQIIDAGASDWVVFPEENGYRQDDSHFLHFILNSIRQALIGRSLQGSSELDPGRLNDWTRKRHNQVDDNELIYTAPQIDFVGIIRRAWPSAVVFVCWLFKAHTGEGGETISLKQENDTAENREDKKKYGPAPPQTL
jgi:hypothetical protein